MRLPKKLHPPKACGNLPISTPKTKKSEKNTLKLPIGTKNFITDTMF